MIYIFLSGFRNCLGFAWGGINLPVLAFTLPIMLFILSVR